MRNLYVLQYRIDNQISHCVRNDNLSYFADLYRLRKSMVYFIVRYLDRNGMMFAEYLTKKIQ